MARAIFVILNHYNRLQRGVFDPVNARRVRVAIMRCYESNDLKMTFESLRACVASTDSESAVRLLEGFLKLHHAVRGECDFSLGPLGHLLFSYSYFLFFPFFFLLKKAHRGQPEGRAP